MIQQQYRIIGTAPLLMHSNRAVDPLDKLAIAMRALTKKRTKTEDNHRELGRLEWLAAIYQAMALRALACQRKAPQGMGFLISWRRPARLGGAGRGMARSGTASHDMGILND